MALLLEKAVKFEGFMRWSVLSARPEDLPGVALHESHSSPAVISCPT